MRKCLKCLEIEEVSKLVAARPLRAVLPSAATKSVTTMSVGAGGGSLGFERMPAAKGGQLTQATWLRGSAASPWRRLSNRVLPQHRNGRFK